MDDDVPVDEDVIKEEELSRFGLLATEFGQHTLSYQHSSSYRQWLSNNHVHSCQYSNCQPSTPYPTSTHHATINGCQATICTAVNTLSTKLALSYQHSSCYHQWLSSNHMHSCQHSVNKARPLLPALILLSPMAIKQPYAQLSTLKLSTKHTLSYQHSSCYHQWLSSKYVHSWQHSVNQAFVLFCLMSSYAKTTKHTIS